MEIASKIKHYFNDTAALMVKEKYRITRWRK